MSTLMDRDGGREPEQSLPFRVVFWHSCAFREVKERVDCQVETPREKSRNDGSTFGPELLHFCGLPYLRV